jgi:hypothetical protein
MMMTTSRGDRITGRRVLELVLLIVGSHLVRHSVTTAHPRVSTDTSWTLVRHREMIAVHGEMIDAAIRVLRVETTVEDIHGAQVEMILVAIREG